MHPTSFLAALSLLSHTSLVSALTTARLWAHFSPQCPPHPVDNENSVLQREFTSAVNIYPNTCTSVFVPLSYLPGVTHLSFTAELAESAGNCTVAVHEVPGCVDRALIEQEVGRHRVTSECKTRNFVAYNQVWVKMECVEEEKKKGEKEEKGKEEKKGEQSVSSPQLVHHQGSQLLVNGTSSLTKQTAPFANRTVTRNSRDGHLLRRVFRGRS